MVLRILAASTGSGSQDTERSLKFAGGPAMSGDM